MPRSFSRPALIISLFALAALDACANPTAPQATVHPSARTNDAINATCKDGGWAGSLRC
jgi:hypothetical protein